jgi:hypothetical protein
MVVDAEAWLVALKVSLLAGWSVEQKVLHSGWTKVVYLVFWMEFEQVAWTAA